MRAEDFLDSTPQAGGISAEDFLGPAKQKKQNQGIAADLVTDVKRGVEQLPGAVTGLVDIPIAAVTGSPLVSGLADKAGEITGFQPSKWAKQAEAEYSPSRQAGRAEVDKAWEQGTASDIAGAYLKNPMNIVGSVAESLPSMLAGGLAGRAALGIGAAQSVPGIIARTVGTKMAPAVGAGIGEGGIMAGQAMQNSLDAGVDPRTAAGYAGATGLVGGALGALGGKVAQKMGVVDPETLIAGGVGRQASNATGLSAAREFGKRIAGGAISEGVFEELPQSVFEQGFQNLAQGKPIAEGMARAGVEGALAGSFMGGAFNMLPGSRYAQAKLQERPPEDEQQPIAGLLPAPRYPVGDRNFTDYDYLQANQAAIDAADKNAADLYAMRDAFEASRQNVVLTTDPVPLQNRIDTMLGLDTTRMDKKGRAQYEKDLAGAFNEPVGITHDANQREVSFTMGEYLDAQVAANDAVRARENFAAQAGNRSSVNRLAQLADEEAQQHIGIVQDLARSATQGGALSKAALTGIQTGATQMPVHPERAAIQQQMLADEAAQAELDPIELFMRGRNERQLQNLSAPGHSQATRQAATAEIERRMTEPVKNVATNPVTNVQAGTEQQAAVQPDPQFDVSNRTDAQLANLASAGKTPEKRAAAAAELQRRGKVSPVSPVSPGVQAAPVTAIAPDRAANISRLQKQLKDSTPMSRRESNVIGKLISAVTDDASKSIEAGSPPAYSADNGTFIVIHPSAQQDGMIQVTRYAENGVFGDSQYNNVEDAIRDNGVWMKRRMTEAEATDALGTSAKAEAEYEKRKSAEATKTANREKTAEPQKTDSALQNRDRGRAASVNQMQSIARNPDYMRLGPSRTPDSGAPMVFAVGNDLSGIPAENFGASDVAVMADGQRVPFRYAVIDASRVQPSNFADGMANPAFTSNERGTIKALNNGRTAGIRAAHSAGNVDAYVGEMIEDGAHGVSSEAIRNTPNPMLVRVYAEDANTDNMAAKSQGQGLGMSASERAAQDAEVMTGDVLDKFAPLDIAAAGNRDFVRAFVGKLPENELADMMDATGNLSQDGRRRIEAALLTAAYGKSDLVQELFESTDTDIKAIGNALKVVSGQWAIMRQAAKDGVIDPAVDMTGNLMEAVNIIRRSRAEGSSVAELAGQGDLMGGNYLNELSELFLRIFYRGAMYDRARSGEKVITGLQDVVTSAMNTKADAGLFGDSFKPTPKQIVQSARNKIDEKDQPASQSALFGANGQATAAGQGNRGEGAAQPGEVGQRSVSTGSGEGVGEQARQVAKETSGKAAQKFSPVSREFEYRGVPWRITVHESQWQDGAISWTGEKNVRGVWEKVPGDDIPEVVAKKASDFYQNVRDAQDGKSAGQLFGADESAQPVKATTEAKAVEPAAVDVKKEAETKDAIGTLKQYNTMADIDTAIEGLYDGTLSLDDYKAAFRGLMANNESIVAELGKLTKDQLYRRVGKKMYGGSETKPELVTRTFNAIREAFGLRRSYGRNSWTMGPGQYEKYIADNLAALTSLVEGSTDEDLKAFADEIGKGRASRQEKIDAAQDPKTLEDFENAIRLKKAEGLDFNAARMSLTPEQRAEFDRLRGTQTRDERKARADQQKTEVRVAAQTTGAQIVEGTHSKHGYPIWSVQLADRVDGDSYKTLLSTAKRMGGNYVNQMQARMWKTVWGFQFRDSASAEAFMKLAAGDKADAESAIQERRDAFADDMSQSAVERLNEMADRMEERAAESLGRERKANTERRARFAASAESAANAEKAMATTMRRIAGAIESGAAQFLDRVRQKAQVEYLSSALRTAKDREIREKYPSYADQEKHRGERPTAEVADYAEFPQYTMMRSDLANLARKLVTLPNMKLLGQRILKVADDTSEAYNKFAKDNLLAVSRFGKADGSGFANFSTMKDAERSIEVSNLGAVAVPVQVKRGEYRIVLSPSEAIKRGIWNGDDRKITIQPDIGAEIVEKLGRLNRKSGDRRGMNAPPEAPWQFENAYNARKRLSGMGIEQPWEFRAMLREFASLNEAPKAADKIKEMERAMIGRKNDGLDFFPTPAGTAQTMIDAAEIKDGMSVLEPSAGMGHIAEQIRESGIEPDVVEFNGDRRELLEAKGFNVVGNDFMEVTGSYDRIIMNPPFSNRRDAEHVQHAYSLLRPGGRLVAIMGEGVFFGQDKKAQQFRDWLEDVGGTSEKLEDGTFMDPSLPVNTATNARMVVIDKPEGAAAPDDKGVALYSKSGNATQTIAISRQQAESRIKSILGDKLGKVLIDSGIVTLVDTEQGLRNLNGAKYMVAWHGSPHDHNKFDSSKIGTGEGAQAYGYGLYFAGSRDVAEYYKETLTNRDAQGYANAHLNAKNLVDRFNGDAEWAAEVVSDQLRNTEQFDQNYGRLQKTLEFIKSGAYAKPLDNPGKLYQVELAPSEDEYLDWDKPLSEQSEFVRKALDGNQTIADRREKLESRKHIYTKSVDSMMDMTGQELYELIADNPTTIRAPGDKAASDYLHSIGIRGIRYLDGSSRSAGEGTSNYVIFSDDDVAITAKYAKENGGIRGATLPDGRIVLVLENLNADNFDGVFAHEGFHSAIRDLVGEQTYAQLMKRLDNMRALGNGGQWFKDAIASVPAGTRTEHVTEEIAAYAVQGYVNGAKQPNVITRWVESLLSALRTAIIRRLPFGKLKSWAVNNLQPQDLANLAIAGLKAKAKGQLQAQGRETMAYSKDASQKTIVVDGIERPTTNSNGKPIAQTEEGMRNFWRWFGDSKAVDADGKPLVVYHGTNADFSVFKTTRSGEFGPAIYLTDNPREAGEYGEAVKGISFAPPSANIMPVYARIENPYTKGVDAFWKEFGRSDSDAAGVERAKAAGYDGIIAKRADRYYDNVAHEFVDLGNTLTHYIAFSNTQVKSAIGNNGDFGTNPDIRYSRAQIVGDSGRQYDPQQRQFFKNVGRDIEKKNLVERTTEYLKNDFWKKMAVGIVDQFRGLRDLGDNGQAYMLARLSKGTAGAFDALLHHGKLSIRDGVYDADTSGGFIDRLGAPLHGELDDFLWYVAANRAEGLSKVDRENLFTPQDIAAGKSLARGQTNFDYTIQTGPQKGTTTRNRTAIYADANRVFNEFQKNTLDMAEQSGLIDGASRKLWESEFYVPFYRVSEEDGEFIGSKMGNALVRQQAFKKLKGGTDKLNSDLLSNTLLNFSHLIEASAKNRAAKASLAAAEKIGAADRVAPDMASYAASNGSMLPPGTKGTVWFQENGKKVEYKVSDPFVMTAITSLEYAGMRNGVMDVMTKFKHFLTIGVTASPAFKVRNLIRDSIQSIGASELGYNPIKNITEGYKQTRRDSQEYVSALASGGLIRFGTMLEGSESARVRQLVKSGVKDSTILNSENKWRAFYDQYLEPAVSAYNELGNRSEEINRAALYNQLVKQGKSHAEAALLARDLMDFSMQGSFNTIRFLTQVVPFMNARLQGMYKLGRAAKDNPRKLAVVTGAVAMASIALMLAYGDDDDWKRREDWDRDNFWWFKLGGIEFRIPKPFEIGAIATLAERGLELMIDDEMTGERFRRVVNSLAMNNLSMNPIPQAFKPILDLYANKDSFTGRPIESMGMERLDPTERFNSNTTMVARGLSSASLGALSPVQFDHLTRSYFGWLGSFVIGGADMAMRAMSDEPTKPALDYFRFGTQGILKEAGTGGSRYVTQVYEQAKELEQAHATWRQMLKDGRIEEAKDYAADNRDKLIRYRQVEAVKRTESNLNERIRRIERSDMDSSEKKNAIALVNKQKEAVAMRIAPGIQYGP